MTSAAFEVKAVECKAVRVIGVKIMTSMDNAFKDCSQLWGDFMPRMPEVQLDGEMRSYGVSVMTGGAGGEFEYWAALPVAAAAPIPAGMFEMTLPAGLYAECWITGLDKLSDCFNYIYSAWLPANTEYEMEATHPSYELYLSDYEKTGRIGIYFPIKKK